MIDEEAADDAAGDRVEVRAILPVDPGVSKEREEGLVVQLGGLERMVAALAAKGIARDAVEVRVDEGPGARTT